MVYQFNSEMQPNTYFHPGDLKYLVPGNEGRWLDPRRTPIRVLEVKRASGFFVIEILDFEDRGARWEVPLEEHRRNKRGVTGMRSFFRGAEALSTGVGREEMASQCGYYVNRAAGWVGGTAYSISNTIR